MTFAYSSGEKTKAGIVGYGFVSHTSKLVAVVFRALMIALKVGGITKSNRRGLVLRHHTTWLVIVERESVADS